MKKYILSFFVIATFGVYIIYQRVVGTDNSIALAPSLPTPTTDTTTVLPVATTPAVVKKTNTGLYKDGQYTGDVVDAYYGNIQVSATISGGKLTDVQFLNYPQDRSTSLRISNKMMPILRQEAIQAQSANVDTVSGATDSSGAFSQSLSSALAQAKNS